MNCDRCQSIMLQRGINGLDGWKRRAYRRHLRACEACAQMENRIDAADRAVAQYREESPRIPDPEATADRILRSIGTGGAAWPRQTVVDGVFSRARIRFAFAAALLILLGWYFVQETAIVRRVSRLEERIAAADPSGKNIRTISTDELAGFLEDPGSLRNRVKEDRVLISKQDLESVVRAAEQNRLMNRVLLNRIRERGFALTASDLDGISDPDDIIRMIDRMNEKSAMLHRL